MARRHDAQMLKVNERGQIRTRMRMLLFVSSSLLMQYFLFVSPAPVALAALSCDLPIASSTGIIKRFPF